MKKLLLSIIVVAGITTYPIKSIANDFNEDKWVSKNIAHHTYYKYSFSETKFCELRRFGHKLIGVYKDGSYISREYALSKSTYTFYGVYTNIEKHSVVSTKWYDSSSPLIKHNVSDGRVFSKMCKDKFKYLKTGIDALNDFFESINQPTI